MQSASQFEEVPKFPVPTPHNATRFDLETPTGAADALEFLEREGYAVIANAVASDQLKVAKDLLWEYLEGVNGKIRRHNWKSWHIGWPGHHAHAVIAEHGIGQSKFLWHLRTQPNVRRVFETVWGTDELLSSFDGCGIFRPWAEKPEWKTSGGWYHVDQSGQKKGKVCVQGFVSLTPASAATGGLVVIPQSHHLHERLNGHKKGTTDFIYMRETEDVPFQNAILVCCEPGDMVIWDSRTIHCSTPAVAPEPHSMDELLRVVAYICMTPRHLATPAVIAQRKRAYECLNTTNHWPHEFRLSSAPTSDKALRKLNAADTAIQELVLGFKAGRNTPDEMYLNLEREPVEQEE